MLLVIPREDGSTGIDPQGLDPSRPRIVVIEADGLRRAQVVLVVAGTAERGVTAGGIQEVELAIAPEGGAVEAASYRCGGRKDRGLR